MMLLTPLRGLFGALFLSAPLVAGGGVELEKRVESTKGFSKSTSPDGLYGQRPSL